MRAEIGDLSATSRLDGASPVPLSVQLEQDLKRLILSGAIASSKRLPRESLLATHYGVSRMTVRAALGRLAEAGLVRRAHGSGTLVTLPEPVTTCDLGLMVSFVEQLRRAGHAATVRVDLDRVEPAERAGEPLGLLTSDPARVIRRIISIGPTPIVVNTSWVPSSLMPLDAGGLIGDSLWRTLSERHGIAPRRADNSLDLVTASSEEARRLHVAERAALMRLTGTVFDGSDRPVEHSVALWSGRVRFHFGSSG